MTPVATYDANFAYAESDRVRSSIVTAYAFPESAATTTELSNWLAERAAAIWQLRKRMVRAYGDIGDAYWSDAPDFDALDHIEALPSMGWDDLQQFLADLHFDSFDRSRPLWHIYILREIAGIDPADGPSTVVILEFHHSMTDGMGAAEIARSLFSAEVGEYQSAAPASRGQVTAREVLRTPLRPFMIVGDLWRLLQISRQMSRDRAAGRWSMPDIQPRLTAVNQPCSSERDARVVFESVSEIRRGVRACSDASVNDAVLAVIGGALARHIGETEKGLVATVPVSVRDQLRGDGRNALAFGMVELRPDLPIDERIPAVNASVRRERSRFQLPPFAAMLSALPRLPGFAYRILDRRSQRRDARRAKPVPTQLKVSTIPKGPVDDWELAGSPVTTSFGVTPLSDGLGVNHTISRMGDVLAIGIIVDPHQLPNLDEYVATLRSELRDLKQLRSA
ncbi:wax ester/triacylglycerol synthase domain-containing protein [Gordonia zhaorongruii]|uniref:wax ester/triacylglycerol synthase domain-containing protein n=1 Tax=Gordonia zhaorongruii TaxID=2597659 RepID=UPI001F1BE944|nr:wax ester/triacylglycerol synthase domain-containing protein [Gordonia zhaorongruii]